MHAATVRSAAAGRFLSVREALRLVRAPTPPPPPRPPCLGSVHRRPLSSTAAALAGSASAGRPGRRRPTAARRSDHDSQPDDDEVAARPGDAAKALDDADPPQRKAGRKTVEEVYQKKTQREHILLRPDTYVGSVERQTGPMWVNDGGADLSYRVVSWVPGLYKIFDEILVNAADNKVRDPAMDTIKITVDREAGSISVYNNGRGIPIEFHSKENMHVPELIFGNLLTSSNYDDSELKVTGGRNGFGAKLCNIFSKEFIVETGDSSRGLKYKQVFSDNMSKTNSPKITNVKKAEDFTRITFKPDFQKFGMSALDDDIVALFHKRVFDVAGCVPGVSVYLNGERIKIKSFKDYVNMFLRSSSSNSVDPNAAAVPAPTVIYERVNDRWEIAVAPSSDGSFQQISFVNSICTSKGGTHVSHVVDPIVAGLAEIANKKDKKGTGVKPSAVKNQLSVFVNCLVENPTFDSQTKECMTLKATKFGSKCTVSEDFIKKVSKTGVIENILAFAKFKSDQALRKTDGHKATRISGIPKLDDANLAGTRAGSDCTLILTEGDSAKSLAVSGLSVVGRNEYGVFPLRGKLLNVRDATNAQVAGNAEITALKQIIGLQQGKVYTSTKELRYGHVMIMTDQDHDGSHIKGLIINFFEHFWPSLLKIPGFLLEFITPIIRVTPKARTTHHKPINFFTIPEFEHWKKNNADGKGWTVKYYKGLGTSTAEDAKAYFSNLDLHRKEFKVLNDEDRHLLDMAFNKKKADERKEWLQELEPGTYMDHSVREIPISEFVNKEFILFSQADNLRSIPSSIDGLKPGHRKILYCCFKRNLKSEIKVTQLAGYVSEHSAYHHGEASLFSTIVGMAQNFVGSNNIHLLEPRGQFGTRLQGGKDAASARYIFTMLNPLARTIYHPDDDELLKYLNDDGQDIEPEWYMPILPMILVNGADGIGTGWSTTIPNYNPRDIVENLYRLMGGERTVPMQPWYRGFRGTIEPGEKEGQFRSTGVIKKVSETQVRITELPVKMWTHSYKEMLDGWMTGGDDLKKQPAWIKDFKEHHSDTHVDFVVTLTEENMAAAEEEGLEKRFKLVSTVNTSNLVTFDLHGRIRKYDTPEELIEDFYPIRLKYYQLRKDAILARLTAEWTRLENRVRFIVDVVGGGLRVQNRKKADVLADLEQRGYVPASALSAPGAKRTAVAAGGVVDAANHREDGKGVAGAAGKAAVDGTAEYDYLLSMPIWSLTMERVNQLKQERDKKQEEMTSLRMQSPADLWKLDLDAFAEQYEAFEKGLQSDDHRKAKTGTVAATTAVAAKKVGGGRRKRVAALESD